MPEVKVAMDDRVVGLTNLGMRPRFRIPLFPKRGPIVKTKFYKIPVDGGVMYSNQTPEEYVQCKKELEEHILNSPCFKDPTYAKRQNDELCHEYFSVIQDIKEEMADYVLVETMTVMRMLVGGCLTHMNFKAKHKDASDSSAAIYFAEVDLTHNKVLCLTKLDIDLSTDTSAYKHCSFCHPDPGDEDGIAASGQGCVYHPVGANLFLM